MVLSPLQGVAQGNETCLDCHDDSEMSAGDGRFVGIPSELFRKSVHGDQDCVDCHSQPGDYEDTPHYKTYQPVDCAQCHDDVRAKFRGSIHEDLFADGDMTCTSCHDIHETAEEIARKAAGCVNCHDDAGAEYAVSVHFTGRWPRHRAAAKCVDCHGSHNVLPVDDLAAPANRSNIPNLCGECHSTESERTKDFVRLPIAVGNYLASVHGKRWQEGKDTAVCTDCHGYHDIRYAQQPEARTNSLNVANTCGGCHKDVTNEYVQSIHGKAHQMGLADAPTCTDCHDEHLIQRPGEAAAKSYAERRATELCGTCHTDPELVSKYGISGGVVNSYLDSYHGWAVDRGSALAATCTDCHEVHNIRSALDPQSSVHADNVVATCGKCHDDVNRTFAASYTHGGALETTTVHGWVRYVYLWLIAVVLGGMAVHNAIVARYEMSRYLARRRSKPYVARWGKAERVQHFVLLASFFGLAITGFALRYPDAWWVQLIGLSGREELRATLHRSFGCILALAGVYHLVWIGVTRRGRHAIAEVRPRYWDVQQFIQNMAFHLHLRKERPAFRKFDYTQKAEYWAVVWGTVVMGVTGLVLWFPTLATGFAPAWIVRVAEVIHWYEAILAVSAIIIWHFFYVIFMPSEYPMSTIWIDGKMPVEEWEEMHRSEYEESSGDEVDAADGGSPTTGPGDS